MRTYFSQLSFALFLFSISPFSAFANDSTAQFSTGGLVLQKSEQIAMLSEKLSIDFKKIKVDYVFENQSDQAVKTLVAFPMPEIEAAGYEQDLPSIDPSKPNNFLHFQVTSGGVSIKPQIEIRAYSLPVFEENENFERPAKIKTPAKEVTALIKKHGLLLSPFDPGFTEKFSKLSKEAVTELKEQGLLQGQTREGAAWTVRISLYWEQVFPAHQKIKVSHQYDTALGSNLSGHLDQKEYCVDSQTEKAIHLIQSREGKNGYGGLSNRVIDYVLSTGANWKGPILKFQLLIKKGKSENILSFCLPGKGLTFRKISPTQFELTGTQFTPTSELHLGFLIPNKLD